jgi:hypothetical protein
MARLAGQGEQQAHHLLDRVDQHGRGAGDQQMAVGHRRQQQPIRSAPPGIGPGGQQRLGGHRGGSGVG